MQGRGSCVYSYQKGTFLGSGCGEGGGGGKTIVKSSAVFFIVVYKRPPLLCCCLVPEELDDAGKPALRGRNHVRRRDERPVCARGKRRADRGAVARVVRGGPAHRAVKHVASRRRGHGHNVVVVHLLHRRRRDRRGRHEPARLRLVLVQQLQVLPANEAPAARLRELNVDHRLALLRHHLVLHNHANLAVPDHVRLRQPDRAHKRARRREEVQRRRGRRLPGHRGLLLLLLQRRAVDAPAGAAAAGHDLLGRLLEAQHEATVGVPRVDVAHLVGREHFRPVDLNEAAAEEAVEARARRGGVGLDLLEEHVVQEHAQRLAVHLVQHRLEGVHRHVREAQRDPRQPLARLKRAHRRHRLPVHVRQLHADEPRRVRVVGRRARQHLNKRHAH
eukprot:Rhum_TRINITY_DN14899_c5_g1::Rhum_TRINITY_DN14899_c5_g1_i1::g.125523::m.125523